MDSAVPVRIETYPFDNSVVINHRRFIALVGKLRFSVATTQRNGIQWLGFIVGWLGIEIIPQRLPMLTQPAADFFRYWN